MVWGNPRVLEMVVGLVDRVGDLSCECYICAGLNQIPELTHRCLFSTPPCWIPRLVTAIRARQSVLGTVPREL